MGGVGKERGRWKGRAGGARNAFFNRGIGVWPRLVYSLQTTMPDPITDAKASRTSLATLFFCTAMPMGMWSVPLANVFTAHGRGHLVPWVFSTTSIAAFISPLFVAALADQKHAPVLLLRWLTALTSLALLVTCGSLAWGWSDAAVLACAQAQALVATPVWSVASSIVF